MQWREELTRRFPALARLPPGSYVVGGAIRDLLLEREPADVDVAAPDAHAAASALRRKVIRLGKEHLSAYRVVDGQHVYDFADLVGATIEEDLARRDFTINAMAVDLATGALLDPHGGRRDLEARVVRMVRASNFDDDPLRLLKAVRMAVRYDFAIEPATLDAIRARAEKILDVAPERVTYELSLILPHVELLHATGLTKPLALPPRPLRGRGTARASAQGEGLSPAANANIPSPDALRASALSRGAGEGDPLSLPAAYALLIDNPRAYAERWRWSDALLRDVLVLQRLIEQHDRVALYDAGEDVARQLPPLLRALGRDDTLDLPDFSIRPLLSGHELDMPPGKELGRVKRALLEAQIRGEVTTREEAERFVETHALSRSAGEGGADGAG